MREDALHLLIPDRATEHVAAATGDMLPDEPDEQQSFNSAKA
jgi:hypothetical protein